MRRNNSLGLHLLGLSFSKDPHLLRFARRLGQKSESRQHTPIPDSGSTMGQQSGTWTWPGDHPVDREPICCRLLSSLWGDTTLLPGVLTPLSGPLSIWRNCSKPRRCRLHRDECFRVRRITDVSRRKHRPARAGTACQHDGPESRWTFAARPNHW